jgi:hypothetical protein
MRSDRPIIDASVSPQIANATKIESVAHFGLWKFMTRDRNGFRLTLAARAA